MKFVECEEHVRCIDFHLVQIEKVILAYRDRYVEIASDKNIKHILILKIMVKMLGLFWSIAIPS